MSELFSRNKWIDYNIIDEALDNETNYIQRSVKNLVTALLCIGPTRGGPYTIERLAESLYLSSARLSAAPLRAAKSLRYISWNSELGTLRCSNRNYYLKNNVSFWNQEEFERILSDVDRRARAHERTRQTVEWDTDDDGSFSSEWEPYDSDDLHDVVDNKGDVPEPDVCPRKRLLLDEENVEGSLENVMDHYNKRFKKLITDAQNMKDVLKDLDFTEDETKAYEKETHDELDATLLRFSEMVEKVTNHPLSKIRSQCPVCNDNVLEPYVLQCGHFMCKTCLDSPLFKKRKIGDSLVVSCPYCRGDQTFAKAVCL